MSEYVHNIDKKIEIRGNRVSYRNLTSYHMPTHSHNAVQVLVPLQGAHFEITWALEEKETESKPLGASDVCLIPPLLEHEVRWSNMANFVNFYITPEFIQDYVDPEFDTQDHIFDTLIGLEDSFIFQLGQSVRHYFLKHPDTHDYKYLDSILHVLAQHLVDNYLKDDTEKLLFNDYAQIPCPKIRESILYIQNHVERSISIEEIADSVNMSHYHFIRTFKEMVGMTPAKFHMMQRIDKAKELLRKKQKIVDVAMGLGFSSQSHFSNVFTKSVGVTPGKYMNQ